MPNSMLSWIAPLSVGAAVMFVLDPGDGRRRRAMLRDRSARLARRTSRRAVGFAQDVRNRTKGMAAGLRSGRDAITDDPIIEARVRTAIGRVATHSGAIAVASIDGIVELNGPVLAREHDDVIRAVELTEGVTAVVDHMSQHEDAANIPGLQGEGSLPESTKQRAPLGLYAACGAAALLFYAATRRGHSDSTVAVHDVGYCE